MLEPGQTAWKKRRFGFTFLQNEGTGGCCLKKRADVMRAKEDSRDKWAAEAGLCLEMLPAATHHRRYHSFGQAPSRGEILSPPLRNVRPQKPVAGTESFSTALGPL